MTSLNECPGPRVSDGFTCPRRNRCHYRGPHEKVQGMAPIPLHSIPHFGSLRLKKTAICVWASSFKQCQIGHAPSILLTFLALWLRLPLSSYARTKPLCHSLFHCHLRMGWFCVKCQAKINVCCMRRGFASGRGASRTFGQNILARLVRSCENNIPDLP